MKSEIPADIQKQPVKVKEISLAAKLLTLIKQNRTYLLLTLIILYCIIFTILYADDFLSFYNMGSVMLAMAIEVIVVMGMTLMLIAGEIDLSVGWNMGLSGVICARLIVTNHMGVAPAILITLLIALLIGLFNGFVVAKVGVNSFITTLASGLIFYGLALKLSGGSTITHLPDAFNKIGQADFLGIQTPVWYALIIILIFIYLMSRTEFFRRYYFIGINAKAATLSGINTQKMKIIAFVISAVLAGFAGIISASRFGNAATLVGQGMELKAITAAVVGGVSFTGGFGTMVGALVGEIFMALINNGLLIANVSTFLQQIIIGLVLLFAVIMDAVLSRKRI